MRRLQDGMRRMQDKGVALTVKGSGVYGIGKSFYLLSGETFTGRVGRLQDNDKGFMTNIELKGLKGLRILGEIVSESQTPIPTLQNILHLPLDFLTPGKYQPRKHIDEFSLIELADSIKTQGIIQPLVVRKIEHNQYEIIAGERRWRAAKIAGFLEVPSIVRDITDNVALAFALIENIQRENLNPIEEAEAFSRFKEEFSMTHADIAQMIGRSRASITNTTRLLSLSNQVRTWLQEKKLDMGHARALLTLQPEKQLSLAQKIIEKQLTVRETEKLANALKLPRKKNDTLKENYHAKYMYWTNTLSEKFCSVVSVKLNKEGAGKIIIDINSPDEIDWIINHIRVDKHQ
jgi:ParB family chromosome partitioning protein